MPGKDVGILRIDHVVGNVELGKMDYWADWYSNILGFKRFISFDDKDINTEYSRADEHRDVRRQRRR